jgi:hypothetical protein
MPRSVSTASLGARTVLGSGGQGTVYAVAGQLIDGAWPAAYKEFSAPVNAAALTAMVAFRDSLPPDTALRIGEVAAWPASLVERNGRVSGFLMRRAPDEFETTLELPSGQSRRLARVELLLNDDRYLTARGLRIDDRFRLELLSDTARTIGLFHRLGVVVGDLSPNNLLFTHERRPRCFFLDCDGMRLRGESVLRAAETVDWHAPPGEGAGATPATDSYKFALLCIRLFAGDQSTDDPAALDRAGTRLRALAERALAADPRNRPGMGQWRSALAAAAARNRIGLSTERSRRRRAVAAALIAVLLILVVAFASCALVRNTAAAFTEDDAAEQSNGVARVVTDAVAVRSRTVAAVRNVSACIDVYTATADLRTSADRRPELLERATTLSTDRLPHGGELRNELITALSHRRLADEAYAAWADAVEHAGCETPAMLGPQRRTGESEDRTAAMASGRFAQLWNPLADRYNHPRVSDQDI